MTDIVLSLAGATKLYAGVPAIENVDFELRRGEIHALVGENGAGKSTLTKVMAGVVTLTSGAMTVDGVDVAPSTPLEARHLGIAMVFQENSLVPTMTRHLHRSPAIPAIAQLRRHADGNRGRARRRQEADGRDRARGAEQGQGHHLR
jgi:ABC-type branched-subunit amino acid transport system ATPase component